MRSLIEQTLKDQELIEKKQRDNEESSVNQEQNDKLVDFKEKSNEEKAENASSSHSAQPLRLKQTARKRPSTHSDQIPKVQTARKHTVSGFLFEKEVKRQIKNIRKRSFQIDIYEIEVDRAEDDPEDPKLKSKLFNHFINLFHS